MKDLKFKAKDINDKWVYGFYHRLYDIDMECFHDYIIDYDGIDTPIDGDTICRFTGELDREGHEIYEHDIVHYENDYDTCYEVVYDEHKFRLERENCKCWWAKYYNAKYVTVIDNVF